MAKTNFLLFNEENSPTRTFTDNEYQNASQRLRGVTPGMALSRQHNKMFYQWSAMCKAVADFLVAQGYDAIDNDTKSIAENLCSAVIKIYHDDIKAGKNIKIEVTDSGNLSVSVDGIIPIENGGTGGKNIAEAKKNLALDKVDNTPDLDKPISKATQSELNLKAPINNPNFTGKPTAPTPAANADDTQIANTKFVKNSLGSSVTTHNDSTDAHANLRGTIVPKDNGAAAVGMSKKFAREDHVHKKNTPQEIGAYTKAETDNRLNGKANANHGNHVPATQAANDTVYLRNDNTWQTITPKKIGAYAKSESVGVTADHLSPTANWNNYTTPGYYPVNQEPAFSATYNQPVGAYTYGCLVVFRAGVGLAQTYYSHSGSQIWHRGGYNGAGWQAWRCLFRDGVATNAYAVLPQGNKNAIELSTTYPVGISAHKLYNGGGPCSYGNYLTVRGDNNGAGQLLFEWTGTNGQLGRMFYRCVRDSAPGIWSGWGTIAYTESPGLTGKPTAPTAATTASDKQIANTEFVKAAIAAAGSGIASTNLAENGHRKYSDGYFEQWGRVSSGTREFDVAFPIAFTTCLNITCTAIGGGNDFPIIRAIYNNKFRVACGSQQIYYRAIGK